MENLEKFNLDNQNLTKEELNNKSEEKKKILDKYRNNKNKKDFRYLIEKLIFNNNEDKITKILYEMINLFHPEIKEKLKMELDKIEHERNKIFWNIEINKWICYYNFIIELYHIFKERYIRLSNISKSNDEVIKFVVNLNKEYYTIKNIGMNEFNENKRRLNDLEFNYNKIKVKNQFETIVDKYEVMLLNEKDFKEKKPPEIKSKKERPIYKESSDENNMKNLNNEKNIGMTVNDLENIEVPKEISIMNLSTFYTKCIQNTKNLPLVVRDIFLSEKDGTKDFNIIENNYKKLKKLYSFLINPDYSNIKLKDSSILSIKINNFIENFESMVMKFKNAAPMLNFGVNIKLNRDRKINEFIKEPKLDEFSLGENEWKSGEFLIQNSFILNDNKVESLSLKRENEIKKLNEKKKKDSKKFIQITKDDLEKKKEFIKSDEQINLNELIKKKEINESEEDENNDFEYFKDLKDKEEEEEGELKDSNSKPIMHKEEKKIEKEQSKEKKNKFINFENFLKNFNEKEGIERTTKRLEELNEEQDLNIKYKTPRLLEHNLLKNDKSNFPVKELFLNSFFIASHIIKESCEYEIPYENICTNILIDCSRYINDINKSFNLIAVFGLTEALYELKIPYSVTVISDENFRTVIKNFEEPHSIEVIQRIRDCAMIQRFKSNYANNLKYAIDKLKYINASRKQRAFFLFSDGLNENLKLSKSWAEQILNNESDSFGFIFIKSHDLIKPEIWENLWNNFDIKVKERGALSFTNIFTYEDNDLFSDNKLKLIDFAKSICSVLNRKTEIQTDTSSQQNLKHCFQINDDYYLNEKILTRFEENCKKKDYNKYKEIYLKINNEKDLSQNILKGVEEKISRENLGKILSTPIMEEKIRIKLKELIKTYIKNKQKINLINLESIYKPNKASQYVLSSTGTDFDITALVLNLINPVPEPLIYLEEKGGLMRNYRVTIILDTSISCLRELSFLHTFQTLNYLLCSCACLDLPCFDFIVARNNNPILLCSEIGTLNALNEKSFFWSSLFTILSYPVINCNLSSAIKLAYDLRRIRSTEKGSFLYILTDGLYQFNERKEILKSINDCEQNGINVIGIGVGIYPKGIEKLFTNSLYCREPSTLIKGISYFFGEEISILDYMPDLLHEPTDSNIMLEIIKKLKDSDSDYISLKNYLQSLPPELDAMQDLYNSEQDVGDEKRGFHNIPEGKNTQIYVKNCLKGHKILIVMLYEEGKDITVQRIFNSGGSNSKCINDAAHYFGISITAVTNYKDAIKEITKQTKPGYCDYYAVWVMSTNGESKLQPKDQKGALNFVKKLEKFWKNGGSLVLFVDNAF